MKYIFHSIIILFISIGCTAPNNDSKEEANDKAENAAVEDANQPDQYKVVLRQIDNRAIVHIDDSVIYDSKTVAGDFNIEIDISKYVEEGAIELRVDLYNGKEPYNQLDTHWDIVYDIMRNDELVEFVRESGDDGRVGKVYTETFYLDELW
ncbi:hypothetical protein [Ekhidna sp.]|jgi:hypothetical protein|uniref:hypothetical protein n=1 Tax=Ekhidna sp. TaxID=2608089 RepID=UPI0032EB72BE